MEYKTRTGDRPTQAHVNYKCPCGCDAGLLYDRDSGPEHLGACCCGRLLWVGTDSTEVVHTHLRDGQQYEFDVSPVVLPWGEATDAALAIPMSALDSEKAKRNAGKTPTKVTDPVCHMMIDPDEAAGSSTYKSTTYFFCAVSCKNRFDVDPKRYVGSKGLLDRIRGRSS